MWIKNNKGRLKRSHDLQLTPNVTALTRAVNSSIDTSTQITFNEQTTMLRLYAISKDVYLKWGTTAVTASNFDEVIPSGQIIDLELPTSDRPTAATVIGREAGATLIHTEK